MEKDERQRLIVLISRIRLDSIVYLSIYVLLYQRVEKDESSGHDDDAEDAIWSWRGPWRRATSKRDDCK